MAEFQCLSRVYGGEGDEEDEEQRERNELRGVARRAEKRSQPLSLDVALTKMPLVPFYFFLVSNLPNN